MLKPFSVYTSIHNTTVRCVQFNKKCITAISWHNRGTNTYQYISMAACEEKPYVSWYVSEHIGHLVWWFLLLATTVTSMPRTWTGEAIQQVYFCTRETHL